MRKRFLLTFAVITAALLFGTMPAAAVTIDWVTVGDPGNAYDDTGYGGVDYVYKISAKEVTNAQYAEFLNAVAAESDPNGLYHADMADPSELKQGGITTIGCSGGASYCPIIGRENKPVVWVSFYDALRFANWLHNGQPAGAQDSTTTEDGAYTFSGPASVSSRNAGATIFLTTEDEWYKAAYYNAVSASYFDYPTGSDLPPTCADIGPDPNTANCNSQPAVESTEFGTTDVGGYTSSPSPYGTFDQGGNVWGWTEEYVLRGGSHHDRVEFLKSDHRGVVTHDENFHMGFRVAMIPEPGTGLLFAIGLTGLAAARRRRALH
jgi:formylglycine-generating enzyme required for sulfatase activity